VLAHYAEPVMHWRVGTVAAVERSWGRAVQYAVDLDSPGQAPGPRVRALGYVDLVGVLGAGDRVLLTSFSDANRTRALAAAERVAGGIAGAERPATSPGRGALIRVLRSVHFGSRRSQALALERFDALQIPERQGPLRVLSPRLIEAAHLAGVEVHVWTVNDPARMKQLVDLGVDGIITDRADLALDALR